MWHDADEDIRDMLRPGEKLLWSGRPRTGIRFRAMDAFLVPFSIVWGGSVLVFEAIAIASGIWFMALFGIPFVLMGVYFLFGRFLVDARQRSNTVYGLSTERAIIVSGLLRRTVKSLNLRTLSDVSLNERGDGSGAITFGAANPLAAWFGAGWAAGMSSYASPSFEMIENAAEVYRMVCDAQKATW